MTRQYWGAGYKLTEKQIRINMEKSIIITVGRQFGSGGHLVAIELGKRLGIPMYDNELITKAAEASGFSTDFFKEKDEKRNFFPLSNYFSSSILGAPQNFLNSDALFKIQSSVIKDIADKESAVIVGRCSNYLLRERKNVLDVFITAPMETRIARVAERNSLSEEKAKDLIIKSDRKRETYYNYFTFGAWGAASDYDLCVDSSILGIEGTADFIIEFAKKSDLL